MCGSEKDYDGFCRNNLKNEKRKALSAFFVNLHNNGMIPKDKMVEIANNLLVQVYDFLNQSNKKSEIEEMTENIAILHTRKNCLKGIPKCLIKSRL